MRGRRILTAAIPVLLAGTALAGAAPAGAAGSPAPSYYLALGDSLSVGWQPVGPGGAGEPTDHGYVDDLYAALHWQDRSLLLEKMGCPGETSTSMIKGGICTYPGGSQLAAAVAFLHTHRVSLVTIDIGANNVDGCLTSAGISTTCIGDGLTALGNDLPIILAALRTADPAVRIVAMNYYDPFLAEWLSGAAGETLARESVPLAEELNGLIGTISAKFGVPVADVSGAFRTTDFDQLFFLHLPVNVVLICAWTWMCAPSPYGPNIHANAFGYAVIAGAFVRLLEQGQRHLR
jgi:lysophospholipase L1-like esterase